MHIRIFVKCNKQAEARASACFDGRMQMNKKVQMILLVITIIVVGVFSYLIYLWEFATSIGILSVEDGIYSGEFKGKNFNGNGTFKSSLGAKYEGQWVDGEMSGYGVMTFADGSKYEGEFEHGSFHGKGKITQADGKVTKGIFENGVLKNEISN